MSPTPYTTRENKPIDRARAGACGGWGGSVAVGASVMPAVDNGPPARRKAQNQPATVALGRVHRVSSAAVEPPPVPVPVPTSPAALRAGFWPRAVAWAIDVTVGWFVGIAAWFAVFVPFVAAGAPEALGQYV